jgi:hypothetical protein
VGDHGLDDSMQFSAVKVSFTAGERARNATSTS